MVRPVLDTADREVRWLLDALVEGADRGLPAVLERLVCTAGDLVGARYGAAGVCDMDGGLVEFVGTGAAGNPRGQDGELPACCGILSLLVAEPGPLRLTDVATHPAAVGFPPHHPPMRSFLGVPIRVRHEVLGSLYVADKHDGIAFTEHDEAIVVALAAAAGTTIAYMTLFDRISKQELWSQASHDITGRLLAGGDPIVALRLIAERARRVAHAPVAAIALPDEDNPDNLVFEVVDGVDMGAEKLTGLSVPISATGSGAVFTSGRSMIFRQYGRHVVALHDDPYLQFPPDVKELDSCAAVALTVADKVLGVLLMARLPGEPPFEDADLLMAKTFADQAALAVEFARAAEDRQRLAVYEDRDRIARDLHDLVIQRLFAIRLGVDGLVPLVGPEAADRVTGLVSQLNQTSQDVRRAIFALQETLDGQAGLRGAMLRIVEDVTAILGFEPRVSFEGPLDSLVPDVVQPDVLATLREALTNAARHAVATTISVEVEVNRSGTLFSLSVTDDGVGIPAGQLRRSGLANLARRAERWGGDLTLKPASGGGTALRWAVRLPQRAAHPSEEHA